MAYLQDNLSYVWTDNDTYEIAGTDPIEGALTGASFGGIGIFNAAAQTLANRTAWLKAQVEEILTGNPSITGNPDFTGTITIPPAAASNQAVQYAQTISGVINNVTGSRYLGTSYSNSYGKPILVEVSVTGPAAEWSLTVEVNSVTAPYDVNTVYAASYTGSATFYVPEGGTYLITLTSGATLYSWKEVY